MTEAVLLAGEIDDFHVSQLFEPLLFKLCQDLPDEKVNDAFHLRHHPEIPVDDMGLHIARRIAKLGGFSFPVSSEALRNHLFVDGDGDIFFQGGLVAGKPVFPFADGKDSRR